jgi:DNA repair protein RadC
LRILGQPGEGLSEAEADRAFFAAMENGGADFLKTIQGLGPAGQARILAAFEIGRRYYGFRHRFLKKQMDGRAKGSARTPVYFSSVALDKIGASLRIEPREWFGFLPVYRTQEVGELCLVERGVRTHVNFDPSELFARLLPLRPAGFFLAHNHPSGNCTPSTEDIHLTARVVEIGRHLGVDCLGHWIVGVGQEQFLSRQSV